MSENEGWVQKRHYNEFVQAESNVSFGNNDNEKTSCSKPP